ncbi:MAG: ROK family protein [Flexilinea sp.]|nr:ROK family protein [Flexilinea sp.]
MTRYALGIDAGATNLRCALVNDQGEILKEIRERSKGIWDGPAYIEQLAGLARQLLADEICKDKEICGLGIGTCGQVNLKGELFGHNGDPSIRIDPPVAIAAALNEKLGIPVKVVNDGQAAIYGEAIYGAGKDVRNVVGFTIGTGIGGGIVLDRKIFQGAQGIAGHLGFLIIDFNGKPSLAGVPGVAEDFGSGTSIGRITREWIAADPERGSYIVEIANGDPKAVTGFQVFEAVKEGDPFAKEIVEYCAKAIGAAAVSMIHALNPDIILLSGGVAEQGDLLVAPIREYVRTYSLYNTRNTPVRIAELGSKAGVVGAAALILAE